MNLDELFKLCDDNIEAFIVKAEEAGFEPDEIWDYLDYIYYDPDDELWNEEPEE